MVVNIATISESNIKNYNKNQNYLDKIKCNNYNKKSYYSKNYSNF